MVVSKKEPPVGPLQPVASSKERKTKKAAKMGKDEGSRRHKGSNQGIAVSKGEELTTLVLEINGNC